MVWDTISGYSSKAINFNHWPQPFNFLRNAKVLMCNQDYWLAEFEFAFDLLADFFWTNLVPSPREIERKVFTGGYRCGFYLDVGIKSPLEIVFGNGTSRMVGEIAAPFARGLFYWWAAETAIDAFALWQTVMFPQLLCDPFVGVVLRSNDRATIAPGHAEGSPGLGNLLYDPLGICGPSQPIVSFPPGTQTMYCAWLFTAGPTGLFNIQTGWDDGGNIIEVENHGSLLPGAQKAVIRQYSAFSPVDRTIGAWFAGDSGPSVAPSAVTAVRFIADWSPSPQPLHPENFELGNKFPPNPKCAQSYF